MKKAICSLAVVCAFSLPTLQAADHEDDLFFEIPVVLSAARLEQPVSEAPIAVTTIDRQMIEASGARNIPDLMRFVPGMLVGHSANEFGDEPRTVVAFQGHSNQYARQMQVLIDGRSIYEPVLGGVNWNNVPINIDDIERIEVTRGPNASSYGSNSFLAVINIITRFAAEDSGHFVRINAGGHDVADLTYRFAHQGEKLDYRVTVTRYGDDGQDGVNGMQIFDSVRSGVIDYRVDYQLDEQSTLIYQGGYSDSSQQARGSVRPRAYVTDRVVDNISAYQYLRFENVLSDRHSLKAQYYYNLFDKDDAYSDLIDFGTVPINDDILTALGLPTNAGITGNLVFDPFVFDSGRSYRSRRHNLEVTHYYEPSAEFRLIWGGGIQKDIGNSVYYFGSSDNLSREIYRIFGNLEATPVDHIKLNAGLLWEKSDIVGTSLSPRVSILGKINNSHTVRISYSEAIRTLFLAEQFANIVLSADVTGTANIITPVPDMRSFSVTLLSDVLKTRRSLDTEYITAREIGYYGHFLDDDLTISARLFHNTLRGLIGTRDEPSAIELVPGGDGEVQVFDNLLDTTIRGFDVELDYYLSSHTRLIMNAASIRIDASYDPSAFSAVFGDYEFNQIAREYRQSAPDYTFTAMLIHRFNEHYSGSLAFFYVGDMAWLDVNRSTSLEGRRNTGGYRKADLRLSRSWNQSDNRASLSLVLQNILGAYQDYDATSTVPATEAEQNLIGFIELRLQY